MAKDDNLIFLSFNLWVCRSQVHSYIYGEPACQLWLANLDSITGETRLSCTDSSCLPYRLGMACSHGSTRGPQKEAEMHKWVSSFCLHEVNYKPISQSKSHSKVRISVGAHYWGHVTIFHKQLETLIQPVYYHIYSIFSIIECRVVCF